MLCIFLRPPLGNWLLSPIPLPFSLSPSSFPHFASFPLPPSFLCSPHFPTSLCFAQAALAPLIATHGRVDPRREGRKEDQVRERDREGRGNSLPSLLAYCYCLFSRIRRGEGKKGNGGEWNGSRVKKQLRKASRDQREEKYVVLVGARKRGEEREKDSSCN